MNDCNDDDEAPFGALSSLPWVLSLYAIIAAMIAAIIYMPSLVITALAFAVGMVAGYHLFGRKEDEANA